MDNKEKINTDKDSLKTSEEIKTAIDKFNVLMGESQSETFSKLVDSDIRAESSTIKIK